jgi:hypothetical protein
VIQTQLNEQPNDQPENERESEQVAANSGMETNEVNDLEGSSDGDDAGSSAENTNRSIVLARARMKLEAIRKSRNSVAVTPTASGSGNMSLDISPASATTSGSRLERSSFGSVVSTPTSSLNDQQRQDSISVDRGSGFGGRLERSSSTPQSITPRSNSSQTVVPTPTSSLNDLQSQDSISIQHGSLSSNNTLASDCQTEDLLDVVRKILFVYMTIIMASCK